MATAREFFGTALTGGRVLHIIGEGSVKAFGLRAEAWIKETAGLDKKLRKKLEAEIELNWRVCPVAVHMDVESQVKEFIACNPGRWDLIIVDTLMRNFAGNINEQADMAKFIKGVDHIAETMGPSPMQKANVIVLHHPGLSATNRGAGSIALPAAVDGIGKFHVKGNKRYFEIDVLRDGDSDEPAMVFELKPVTLEVRSFDDPPRRDLTSAVLILVGREARVGDDAPEATGMTGAEELLLHLWTVKPKTQRQAADGMKLSEDAIGRRVKDLRMDKLVTEKSLKLTPKGEKRATTLDVDGGAEALE